MTELPLHASQNRALRELHATTRQLIDHWAALAPRVHDEGAEAVLEDGAETARSLQRELHRLTQKHDLHGGPAAQGVGVNLSRARSRVGDSFLERNQALRLAVLDVQHVVTLLGYLARVADTREQSEMAEFCRQWERDMRAVEDEVRAAAIESGAAPDAAIEPLDSSPLGRAAHGLNYAVGAFGEWFDRRTSGTRSSS